jgi:serine/threonine-protein kinase
VLVPTGTTAPLTNHPKAHAVVPVGTSTQARVQRRATRAALVVASASVLLAVALTSTTCLRKAATTTRPEVHPLPQAQVPTSEETGVGGGPQVEPVDETPNFHDSLEQRKARLDAVRPQAAPVEPAVIVKEPDATLRVQTDGPASFVVDGTPLKPADDGALHLAAGRHTVQVSSPALAYSRTLTVDLKPSEAALRAVHGGKGQLRVAVTPWAELVVDGKSLGVTPLQPAELSEGSHLVTLRNSDLGVTTKRKILVLPNRESVLKVDLFAEKKGG